MFWRFARNQLEHAKTEYKSCNLRSQLGLGTTAKGQLFEGAMCNPAAGLEFEL
jgi:hypothetical protein